MIGVVLVSQGKVADELLRAAEVIAGPLSHFRAVSLDWNGGFEEAVARIEAAVREVESAEGALVLTDMFGSTPSNAALAVTRGGHREVVTGMNLPMVLRLGCAADLPATLSEAARWLEQKGKRSICRGVADGIRQGSVVAADRHD